MIRKIIQIDTDKCNGCGACANACHEGAIAMVNGKAKLMRDDYCDGFGDCLPHCPTSAITFVEREAAAYDEKAVEENKRQKAAAAQKPLGGCPGSAARSMFHQPVPQMHHGCPGSQMRQMQHKPEPAGEDMPVLRSQLSQWPVQIKLVPVNAPYFDGAKLLIAADWHGLCLRQLPSKVHPRPYHAGGLPQAGRCGLQRKVDPDYPRK